MQSNWFDVAGLVLVGMCAGCGSDSNPAPPNLLGLWTSQAGTTTITAEFKGANASGTVELAQKSPVTGDLPSCEAQLISANNFVVSGTSMTITATSARQRAVNCSMNSDDPISDLTSSMSFAAALSGPFTVTETTLKLGTSYPMFFRLTR